MSNSEHSEEPSVEYENEITIPIPQRFHVQANQEDLDDVVKQLCAEFLCGKWTDQKSITTKLVTEMGSGSKLYICKLPSQTVSALTHDDDHKIEDPDTVMVRINGNTFPMATIGEAGQALVMDALAKSKIGPKVLGVFDGGRIEEFINARNLMARDCRNMMSLAAIARLFASLHSINVPLKRDPMVYTKNCREAIEATMSLWRGRDLSGFPDSVRKNLEKMVKIEVLEWWDFMSMAMEKLKNKSRVVLGRFDNHPANFLVNIDTAGIVLRKCDLMIVDVENMNYYYRGLDLGTFLNSASYHLLEDGSQKFVGELDEGMKKHFIKEYLAKWRKLNPISYNSEIDNEENLYLEASVLSNGLSVLYYPQLLNKIENNLDQLHLMVDEIEFAIKFRLEMDEKLITRAKLLKIFENVGMPKEKKSVKGKHQTF